MIMAANISNQWTTLNSHEATVKFTWQPWEDVRQYQVQQINVKKTRYNTIQHKLSYDLALAAHTLINKQTQIEILKHNFKLNGKLPATFTQQIMIALQEALFPYTFIVKTT